MESRLVDCRRCGETREGLGQAPLSGEVGRLVYQRVCRLCWEDWFEQSVNVINHYGLNPALPEHRQQLYDVMKEFLNIGD